MNAALEWLLTTRANIDSNHKELKLNTEVPACLNEAQAIKAIKEAEVCHTAAIKEAEVHHATSACIIQQTYQENVVMLEHKVKVEGGECQAFVETLGVDL